METGRIVHWDQQKGYGYVESGQRRLFLHFRDFAERHKTPEVGDVVVFSVGTDRKGRPCATQAVQRRTSANHSSSHDEGGRVSLSHLLLLLALLVAPTIAGLRLTEGNHFWYLAGWCVAVSGATYFIYADDKQRAQEKAWRAPEKILHVFELIGGWPGAFIAQRKLRHKNSKLSFQFVFWFIVALHQFVAVDYLLGWPMSHAVWAAIGGKR